MPKIYVILAFLLLVTITNPAFAYDDNQRVLEHSAERQRETELQRNYDSRQQTEEIQNQIQENARQKQEEESQRQMQLQVQQDLSASQRNPLKNGP
jgi:hypothetical protein